MYQHIIVYQFINVINMLYINIMYNNLIMRGFKIERSVSSPPLNYIKLIHLICYLNFFREMEPFEPPSFDLISLNVSKNLHCYPPRQIEVNPLKFFP